MPLATTRDLVLPAIRKHGNRTAVIADGRTWSYRELHEAALVVADMLIKRGIRPSDPVAILLPNSAEYLIADLAIIAVGAAKVPINLMLSQAEVEFILADSGAEVVLTASAHLREPTPSQNGRGPEAIVLEATEGKTIEAAPSDSDRGPTDQLPTATTADDLSLIMYTGGTTGRPKGVVHRQRGVVANLLAHVIETEITADDHLLLSSPLPHSAGVLATTALLRGAIVEVMSQFDLDTTLDKVESAGVTYLFLVPTMINRLLDGVAERGDFDSRSLKTILYGASPISEERLRQGLSMFGPVFMQLYGQTEAPNFLTRLQRHDHDIDRFPHRLRSCGQSALMASMRIVHEDGTDCEPNEVGEVIGAAPYVMDRYWNRPEATDETLRDGWLHTGDLGYLDTDGYLYLVDRKKDMIITGGLNVYASEVEQALSTIEEVRDVAVIGIPHPDWGEAVTAYVIPANEDATEHDVIAASRAVLTSYKRPKYVHFTDALPTTAVGKINKKVLRQEHTAPSDSPRI